MEGGGEWLNGFFNLPTEQGMLEGETGAKGEDQGFSCLLPKSLVSGQGVGTVAVGS